VVAALLELDHRAAAVAALPARLLRRLKQAIRLFGARTLLIAVPLPAAERTHLRLAAAALAVLDAVLGVVVGRLDPLAAAARRAVDAVLGRVLLELAVPLLLEGDVAQLVHVLQGDAVRRAAFGRHVLWIGDGEPEDPPQAGVAHAVAALKLGRLVARNIVRETGEAFDAVGFVRLGLGGDGAGGLTALRALLL
jgi:hypothetical protein